MSKKAIYVLALLNDPRHRDRLLESLNKSTLDEGAAPIGKGDQEMKVLKEMNELQRLITTTGAGEACDFRVSVG